MKTKVHQDEKKPAESAFENEAMYIGHLRDLIGMDGPSVDGPDGQRYAQLQAAADVSPQVSELRAQQAAADASPQVGEYRAQQAAADASSVVSQFRVQQATADQGPQVQESAARQAAAQSPKENKTGLPDQLKTGIEDLSGLTLDDVQVHYNSDKPAEVQAHAFAQGSEIHIAPGQEEHLPHEAWHVVQQKQGRVRPTQQLKGKAINDDEALEKEADEMGAKAMQYGAQGIVPQSEGIESAAAEQASIGSAMTAEMPMQRVITFLRRPLKTLRSEGDPVANQFVNDILRMVAARIDWESPPVNIQRLERAWNKLVKAEQGPFELGDPMLVEALVAGYHRSRNAAVRYGARRGQATEIVAHLMDDGGHDEHDHGGPSGGHAAHAFKIVALGRGQLMVAEAMSQFAFDTAMSMASRVQRYISTVLLRYYTSAEAIEVQASIARDGSRLGISSNRNKINRRMAAELTSPDKLAEIALEILMQQIGELQPTEEQLMEMMDDRESRHAMKLLARLHRVVRQEAGIAIPNVGPGTLDGRHAEIRLHQMPDWSPQGFYLPNGTKVPCMGCTLYFNEEGIELTLQMGPMWISDAGLSTQLEQELLNHRGIGRIKNVEVIAAKLRRQFEALRDQVTMGSSRTRAGGSTYDHDPDSDSDLEGDDLKFVAGLVGRRFADRRWQDGGDGAAGGGRGRKRRRGEDDSDAGQPGSKRQRVGGHGHGAGSSGLGGPGPAPSAWRGPMDPIIEADAGVNWYITDSVMAFLRSPQSQFTCDGPLFIADGADWTCYIRCVLRHFGRLDAYHAVLAQIGFSVYLGNGIMVGGRNELVVQAAIQAIIGRQYYAEVTDVGHGGFARTWGPLQGERVQLVRTGAHFSLLLPGTQLIPKPPGPVMP